MRDSLLTQMINEVASVDDFCSAARLAQSHVEQGIADPGLVAHLAMKGHFVIDRYVSRLIDAHDVSQSVLRVAATSPPQGWPDSDLHPCRVEGEHLSSQRHPRADCALFFGENG